jgi:hypothetical protein
MDPQTAWKDLIDAYQVNDWRVAQEAAEALTSWLAGGGFPPQLDNEDDQRRRVIVQLCCAQALAAGPPFYCD